MNSNAEIVSLIRKRMEGTITEQELRMLESWGASDPLFSDLLKKVEDEELLLSELKNRLAIKSDHSKSDWLMKFEEKTLAKVRDAEGEHPPRKKTNWGWYLSCAALLISVLGIGLILYRSQINQTKAISISDLAPGGNKAKITLADGRVIELNENQDAVVMGDELAYADGTLIQDLNNDEDSYATISTPRGGQYQITLSDGTKVWLNADSKLTYPLTMRGKERVVELDGEAYFDVESKIVGGKKIPFKIKTSEQVVEVTGTQFNLKAYADEQYENRTTLVEGSVVLHAAGKILPLKAGEQGFIDQRGLHKKQVDIGQYVAWKDNQFVFEEVELGEAMRILSRWYDFDFEIDDRVKRTYLYASISRGKNLKEVLKIIEGSGFKFKLERIGERNKLSIFN
ncbi:FecR family protein [Sphingobacterium hotanense]|uniref:FecR family protein n=1 Tax=Sphingobacterium hotanense TaxID=649196 RepID=A0ABT7NKY0_9SPHI|nr:FecR family protein [Sphingobacterium hotanense]MDM1047806.1 FecR family protein [Sphingobacterium hotanense]